MNSAANFQDPEFWRGALFTLALVAIAGRHVLCNRGALGRRDRPSKHDERGRGRGVYWAGRRGEHQDRNRSEQIR